MTWYRAGGGGIPSSLKTGMNSVLNKKFGTSTTYPPTGWPDNVNLLGPLPEKTVSGAIASFSDGADDVPIKSVLCTISPSQSGAGTPSPSNPRSISGWTGLTVYHAKKNIFDFSAFTTFSNWRDDITTNPNYATSSTAKGYLLNLKNGTYTLSFGISAETFPTYLYLCRDNGTTSERIINFSTSTFNTNSGTFTVEDGYIYYIRLSSTGSETAFNNQMAKISNAQLEVGNQATDYEPFSQTSIPVTWSDTAGTVYGGTLSNDGLLTVTHKISTIDENSGVIKANAENCFYLNDFFDVEDANNTCVCNVYTKANNRTSISTVQSNNPDFSFCRITSNYTKRLAIKDSRYSTIEDFNTWLSQNPIQIVQELASSLTYQLTEIELSTYLGDNNIWADTGDISCTYRADIALALGGGS